MFTRNAAPQSRAVLGLLDFSLACRLLPRACAVRLGGAWAQPWLLP
jgi:hypothetical protein